MFLMFPKLNVCQYDSNGLPVAVIVASLHGVYNYSQSYNRLLRRIKAAVWTVDDVARLIE